MQTEDTLKSCSETLQADFRWPTHHDFRALLPDAFSCAFHFPRASLRIAGAERDNSDSEKVEGTCPEGENR
jgi:hypothetical protein